jgi:transposase
MSENGTRLERKGKLMMIRCAEAGQKAAITYTVVEKCRRLGIDTREYLEDVLTLLPGMMASDAVKLTPANWLRARQGKPARKAA